jgi:uncharacterized protein (UPF0264 family)
MSFMAASPSRGWIVFHDTGQDVTGYGALCSTRSRDRSIASAGPQLWPPALLASAADPDEARMALLAGADIVDLKDPARGALGACDPAVLALAASARRRHAPDQALSAALGPARAPEAVTLAAVAGRLGFEYLKTGLDGAPDTRAAAAFLLPVGGAARRAAPGVRLIAAGYADAQAVGSLEPADLPAAAAAAGFDGCLLDTAVKDGRSVIDHLGHAGIAAFVRACRARRLLAAVAGSIGVADLTRVVAAGPDVIGARGALCDGGRRGRLDPGRVRDFRAALRSAARPNAASG